MNLTELVYVIMGMWIGALANTLWYSLNHTTLMGIRWSKYRSKILVCFEHYHHAMISMIFGIRLLYISHIFYIFIGLGIVLLFDEALAQKHKFAINSDHFIQSTLIAILIIMLWVLAELIIILQIF